MKVTKKLLLWAFVALVVLLGAGAVWIKSLKMPDFVSFENRKVVQSTRIYDRTGNVLLWDVHQDIKRTVVPFDQISKHIKDATVAIEDDRFYQHSGIDLIGIARSIFVNLTSGSLKQGGSTISQQLIKNALLTNEKSFTRKIKEVILTLKLEKNFSKDEILNLYLNEIPYGGSNYGVEAASQNFFGKHASDLTIAEAAYLASIPKAPTYYSPYGNHRKELDDRKNLTLKRMRELGFISSDEEKQAQSEKVIFLSKGDQSLKAPHFSVYIRSYLEEKYGKDVVEQDGLKVTTTLDYDLQQKAEDLVKTYAEKNKKEFGANNAALVAVDPKTGQILTMVGSKDYFDTANEGNFNVTIANRQPGSSFKPFAYATAFKKGFLPSTVLFDISTEFNSSCNPDHTPKPGASSDVKCYSPDDFDGKYRGPISMRNALAQSLNIPSVKTLYLAGIGNTIQTAKDLGITSLGDQNRYGLTLVLGGGEVSPLEMAGAYSVFANSGERNPVTGILKVEDSNGNVLEEFKPQPQQVLDKNVALMISDVLSDYDAKKPTFGDSSPLYFADRKVAAKTGTTNDIRDAWVVGYTPSISVAVWSGNNDNTPMTKKSAASITAPLWNAFMQEAFKKIPLEQFEQPVYPDPTTIKPALSGEWRGGQTYKVDKTTGKLATEFTPPDLIEYKAVTQVHTILYWLNKDDPNGPAPQDPTTDSQFNNWEKSVRDWATSQGLVDETVDSIPKNYDDVHLPGNTPAISLLLPQGGASYHPTDQIKVKFSYSGKYQLKRADYFLNDTFLGSTDRYIYEFSFVPSKTGSVQENSTLKIVVYDEYGNRSETNTPILFTL